ncbi:MAG: type II secretion system protein [Pseudobacteriovorax sp.]|nr:type II secretion system protein [Pseudobacteriovorax sp.]
MFLVTDKKIQRQRGFSIIEILIVIAVVAGIFVMVSPSANIIGLTDSASKISTLAGDIRGVYDLAVLNRKPYRMGFEFHTGKYWVETTDRNDVYIAEGGLEREYSEEELAEKEEEFLEELEEYQDLAGEEVQDQEKDQTIPPTSPLVQNFDKLKPPKWEKIDDPEFSGRSLGPYFIITGMQAEHHSRMIRLEEYQEEALAYLYFFPHGYVQRAVIHVAYKRGDLDPDPDQEPYTFTTQPYEGVARVESGFIEVDIREEPRPK